MPYHSPANPNTGDSSGRYPDPDPANNAGYANPTSYTQAEASVRARGAES